MTTPIFNNKDGSFTHYALACGYIDTVFITNDGRAQLSYNGSTYDVQTVRNVAFQDSLWTEDKSGRKVLAGWAQFDTLTEARTYIRKLKKSDSSEWSAMALAVME